MPIKETMNLALIVFAGICITHPMDAALTLRRIELSMLKKSSSTKSWGMPVVFPVNHAALHHKPRAVTPAYRR
jgi:hypothetical protein